MAKKELSVLRRHWAMRLSQIFTNDYEDMLKHYKQPQQEELTEHLIGMLNIINEYAVTKNNIDYERYTKSVNDLQKKYGNAFAAFTSKNFYRYFYFEDVIAHKGVISTEEYNALACEEEQTLTPEEIQSFVRLSLNYLYHSRSSIWAKREPEYEASLSGAMETADKKRTKGIPQREAGDNLTKLNQEQTALLFAYLQKGHLILKDEYLNNTQAGEAVSILTGYSAHTLRQKLGKTELERIAKENKTEFYNCMLTFIRLIKSDLGIKGEL